MGKRKLFHKTDLSIPQVEYRHDAAGCVVILPEAIPPANTLVAFSRNASSVRSFDFARWYGLDIDPITYACQRQIERYLAGQDGQLAQSTIVGYCNGGIQRLLDYLVLCATALGRELTLNDIDRALIDGFLGFLAAQDITTVSQKAYYTEVKSVLTALGRRGLIILVRTGDDATFPTNPFPNSNRKSKGETSLPRLQRQALSKALKQDVQPIWREDAQLTADLLACAMLIVALYTGRNTTPLLELGRNCLVSHPKDSTSFLVLWKRRGHTSSKVALRKGSVRGVESTPTVRGNVERIMKRVLELSEPLRAIAPEDLKERVWLYISRASRTTGDVTVLTDGSLRNAIKKLVKKYNLMDSVGMPLRVNVSRLRKTFANRIYELLGGDLVSTAIALGNTPQVAGRNYLAPGETAMRNWQFMGEILVQELLTHTIGATYHSSPMGHCGDPENGEFAPKQKGAVCTSFLNCLRCKHYAVTGEDLYKLFSFYYRVFAERTHMSKARWAREYAHIPRLIDDYIVAEGLRRGVFKARDVDAARTRARQEPHPFWSYDVIETLEVFS
ncbi:hypothetical protein IB254_15740 [Pseudomonas sp. PDM03]|jgi:hypothetical protein|uniref:hypothetical protein n=1 Tax=unclassified Pseudomonas TaxID=196821 RepID=UPI0017804E83|nr:hypothetical protein [Pseudomonas sp. PDM03]MBD9588520.1 hypothetical protein [Pseudomonas sp. PDM03]